MATIDIQPGVSMGHSETEMVQKGGGGGAIEMYGGDGVTLSQSPTSMVQKGGGGSGIEMVGEQGLFNMNPVSPYGSHTP